MPAPDFARPASRDIRIIDPASDFGGTWYWNRYPGIACDIESYTYLPLLEELGYVPKEKYSFGPEILEHSQAIARKFDLYRDACFQTRVEELRWDEDQARWIVETNRGDCMKARYVCLAAGPLNRPKLPGIPGIENFEGHSFHASRWDYEYTGGDSKGSLTGLASKRVGIIGTGATSVQIVPHVGEAAEELLRVPAHAVLGRRQEQPAHRSRMGQYPEAGLAPAQDETTSTPSSRACHSPRI